MRKNFNGGGQATSCFRGSAVERNLVHTTAGRVLTALAVAASAFSSDLSAADMVPGQESQFLKGTRQLTFEGRRSGEGYFSPDGRKLVFQSEREAGNPFYQIYVLDFESGETKRLSPGTGKTTCAFFRPGSDEILFASTHLDPEAKSKQQVELDFRKTGQERRYSWDYDEQMDLFTSRPDGSRLRRLTEARGYDAEGSFSPDGKQIVFTSLRHAFPLEKLSTTDRKRMETDPSYFGDIYLMKSDGTGVKRLTDSPGYDGGPFFSPDGKRIVWRRFTETGATADIFTMKTDGTDVRRITDFGAMSWAPYYHPSGKYFIFTANKLGFSNFELYLVSASGGTPVRVTFTDGFDGLPVFSPDGRKLCWTANRTADGKSQLFLAEWNHAAALAAIKARPAPPAAAQKAEPKLPKHNVSTEITAADCEHHVRYLASDEMEGRRTGSRGSELAADYIARQLALAGAKPVPGDKGFFHEFDFNAGVRLVTNENHLTIRQGESNVPEEFGLDKDFRPLSFSSNGTAEDEVVFAGYGLFVPGAAGQAYDSYGGLSVSNKIVLVLRYVPESVEPARRQELNRYAALRYKAMLARERGAKAILVVTGPNSPNSGELAALTGDGSLAGSGIIAASITTNVATRLLAASGKSLAQLQAGLDTENPHAEGAFVIPKTRAKVTATLDHIHKKDRNVIAVLLPARKMGGNHRFILVGAHYDHLGMGDAGSSLAEKTGEIHNGADDNASGVAAVLELAAAFGARGGMDGLGTGIMLALWSGEEMGLLGSAAFVEHPPLSLSNVAAYVNFDMVGRLRENKLMLQGAGSSSAWRRLIEKRNVSAGFNVVVQDDPYLPTDTTSLYPKGLPVLNFFTGSHEQYHRPTDDPETLNYSGLERVARFAKNIITDLAKGEIPLDYVKVEKSDKGGSRDNLRVYLGTIPDYATEVAGVKLTGVRPGSPAEKAGLKGGDIIVSFAGQKIANIYDYTYALDAARIGQPLEIIVTRDGQRVPLQVTPEARK